MKKSLKSYGLHLHHNELKKELFIRKSSFLKNLRLELEELGAIELYMPILQNTREGAPVHQFETTHPLTNQKFYLRHCMEDHLRRLAYSYSQVFEIGKAFRVEIEDEKRLNEFLVLEYVSSNLPYQEGVQKFIDFIKSTLLKTYGALEINNIDFSKVKFVSFNELLKDVVGFGIFDTEFREKSANILKVYNVGITPKTLDWEIFEELLKYKLEPSLIVPTVILDFPLSLQHVAEIDNTSNVAKRFSFIVKGIEIADGGEKLKNSVKYQEIYSKNAEYRKNHFNILDNDLPEEFFNEMDYFNQNVFTFGLGIDRLFSICENKTIKEVTMFSYE